MLVCHCLPWDENALRAELIVGFELLVIPLCMKPCIRLSNFPSLFFGFKNYDDDDEFAILWEIPLLLSQECLRIPFLSSYIVQTNNNEEKIKTACEKYGKLWSTILLAIPRKFPVNTTILHIFSPTTLKHEAAPSIDFSFSIELQ